MTAPGPNGFEDEAELGEFIGARAASRAAAASPSSTISGSSRVWRGDAVRRQRLLHPLIDEPLMGGMLVDEHDAVGGLGEDVGAVQLRARRAERIRSGGLVRRRPASARAGAAKTLRSAAQIGIAGFGQRQGARAAEMRNAARSQHAAPAAAGAKGAKRRGSDRRRGAMPGGGERLPATRRRSVRAPGRVAKPHLGLGRDGH